MGLTSAQPAYIAQGIRLGFLHASGERDMMLHQEFRIRGPLDVDRLAEAVRRLVMRRDSLRSQFELRRGRGWQVFLAPGEGPTLQIRSCDDEISAQRWLEAEIWAPFDLFSAPTARFGLARTGPDTCLLGIACSHEVSDGSSLDLIVEDLEALYAGAPVGDAPSFAAWARRRGRYLAEVEESARAFWHRQFPGPPPGARLPPPTPEPADSIVPPSITLQPELVAALRHLAGESQVSLYMVLLAAVHLVRSSEQTVDDLTYAVNVANRDDAAADATVGCLTHRVLVRVRGDAADFVGLLAGIRETMLAVLRHSAVPFRVVRSWLADWHGVETPLSDLTYVVLGPEWGGRLRLPGVDVERLASTEVDPGCENLEFWFTEDGDTIRLELRYPPAHYSAESAAALCDAVGAALREVRRDLVAG